MILTDRELFMLIICTVFYVTLFILVIQNNRRKIQLLQSRLDNIHAMQKMAVIEPRRQDVSTLFMCFSWELEFITRIVKSR